VRRAGGGGARGRRRGLGARTTDTIAAINIGEQPLTSPSGGPILYFISKLIPREQIYCKKGVKKYIFSAHGPPAFGPSPRPAIRLAYRVNLKVPEETMGTMLTVVS